MTPSTAELVSPAPTTDRKRQLIIVSILLVVLIGAGFAIGRYLVPGQLNGVILQANGPVPDFTLTNQEGVATSLSDFRGDIVMLYFGYTYCPDVCPITLSVLDKAINDLPTRHQDDIQVIMVSVDPERDSPDVLDKYLDYFNPDFVGLTGTVEEVELAASPMGVYFAKREVDSAAGYFVDHTASVAVVDKEGNIRLLYPYETPAEDITADLRILLRE